MGDTLFSSLSKAIDMGLATKERLEEAVCIALSHNVTKASE